MSLGTHMSPLHDKIMSFSRDVTELYKDACDQARVDIRAEEQKDAIRRLYELGALSKFTAIKANTENAKYIHNIYKLIKEYEGVKGTDADKITAIGKAKGFTEEESQCLYNMSRFEAAIANLKSQRAEVADLLLSEL